MALLYKANFAKPLPRNVLELVRAKWDAASIEATGAAQPLPPFKSFKLSRPKDFHFPALVCYRRATRGIEEATNFLLDSKPEFALEVAHEGADEDALMEELETRVEIVDSIIRTAARKEPDLLLKNFPEWSKTLVTIEIPEHVYGQNVPQGTKHIRVAALTLRALMKEP